MAEQHNHISKRQFRDARGRFARKEVTAVPPTTSGPAAPIRSSIRRPSSTGPSRRRGTSTTPGPSRGKEKAAEEDEMEPILFPAPWLQGRKCSCCGGSWDEDEIDPSRCSFCRELWEEGFRCVAVPRSDNEKGKRQKVI